MKVGLTYARIRPPAPTSPSGRYYSRMHWTLRSDEGDYDVEFWVIHRARISIMDMNTIERIEYVHTTESAQPERSRWAFGV